MFQFLMDVLTVLWGLLQDFAIEILLFLVIDGVTKHLLRNRSEEEKNIIWTMECVCLLFATIFMWWNHHLPSFLLSMLVLFVWHCHSACSPTVRFALQWIISSWDDFEQHQGLQRQPLHGQDSNDTQTDTKLPPAAPSCIPTVNPVHQPNSPVTVTSNSGIRQRPALHSSSAQSLPQSLPDDARSKSNAAYPLHGSAQLVDSIASRIRGFFSSVYPVPNGRKDNGTPPGLENPGHNTCFLNVIIQALSHTPSLSNGLNELSRSNPADRLVRELAVLVECIATPKAVNSAFILDTSKFREVAAFEFPSGLLQLEYQRQQDAAECLTWMINWLHARMARQTKTTSGLCGLPNGSIHNGKSSVCVPRYFTEQINSSLTLRYGSQPRQCIADLRSAAIQQVEHCNGMNCELYFPALLTVSDIDWYQLITSSNSCIQELFMGQLVDVTLCEACRHVSVSTQTFHILAVPVSQLHQPSQSVTLKDCLDAFASIERMDGANSLKCEPCNRSRTPSSTTAVMRTPVDRYVAPLSPINAIDTPVAGRNSSYHDVHQRTSTPILAKSPSTVFTNCLRRSLIGYLPGCLIVQLLRFNVDMNGKASKISVPVNIPLERLDVSSLVLHNIPPESDRRCQSSTDVYNLYAVCVHTGSDLTSSGHYIAYARCADGMWYCFNDDTVHSVNMAYELTTRRLCENAYLLFYERAC